MGTKYKGTAKEINALNTYIKLIRASDSISSRIHRRINMQGLSESQFGALDVLLHLGPITQKDLGSKLLKSGGNITMVVDNLEKRGFVERRRNKEDRRLITLHLTKKGKNKIKSILPDYVQSITGELKVLNKKEQHKLQEMLKLIGSRKK